ARTVRGPDQARGGAIDGLCFIVAESAALSSATPSKLRGMGQQSIRQTSLQHLLQELHRKSLGDELQGNLRGLGCTTHPWPFSRQRNQERAFAAAFAKCRSH